MMQPFALFTARRALLISAVALVAGCAQQPSSQTSKEPVRLMTSGGFTAAHKLLAPQFTAQTGIAVESAYGSSMGSSPTSIPNRLSQGEKADVVILARGALDDLAAKGLVKQGTQIDLVLLNAKSIAYSASASGTYYETQMLKKLGIHDQVMPKSKKIVTERVGTIVARGEAEIGLQQVSELLPIEGISYAGTLPDSVQHYTLFSAGTASTSTNPQGLEQLLKFYTSPAAAKAIRDTGLEPIAKPR